MRRREEKRAEINVADGISLFVLTYKNKDFRLWRHTRAKSVHQPSHNVQTETFLVKWCRQIIVLNCWCCFSRFTAFVSKGEKKTNLNQQIEPFLYSFGVFKWRFHISFVHSIICFILLVWHRNEHVVIGLYDVNASISLIFLKLRRSLFYSVCVHEGMYVCVFFYLSLFLLCTPICPVLLGVPTIPMHFSICLHSGKKI